MQVDRVCTDSCVDDNSNFGSDEMATHRSGSARAVKKSKRGTLSRSLKRQARRRAELLPGIMADLAKQEAVAAKAQAEAAKLRAQLQKAREANLADAKAAREQLTRQGRALDEVKSLARARQQEVAATARTAERAEASLEKERTAKANLQKKLSETQDRLSASELRWAWVLESIEVSGGILTSSSGILNERRLRQGHAHLHSFTLRPGICH